ncbi:adenosine deaminase [Bacteroidota bacterium]
MPKVELHLHLDCSLSYDVVSSIDPSIDKRKYNSRFIAPSKCKDLADFLRCTTPGIGLMQTKKNLELVVDDLFRQLIDENVIYAEIRFAPLLHLEGGLHSEEVVEIVSAAVEKNIDLTGIKAGLILCTLRHYSEDESMRTVKLINKYIDSTPVCGFDLAADEAGFPIDAHVKSFRYAIDNNIPRTAHAGEARGPESVWETLRNLKPSRIGHGVRGIEDPKLIEYLIENSIHLEVCPTCNIQTNIYTDHANHPVDKLYKSGVSVGINTDARTLTNITLTGEYEKLMKSFGWNEEHFIRCNSNALAHSFLPESDKSIIRFNVNWN